MTGERKKKWEKQQMREPTIRQKIRPTPGKQVIVGEGRDTYWNMMKNAMKMTFQMRQVKDNYKRENSDSKLFLCKESEDTVACAQPCKIYKLRTF